LDEYDRLVANCSAWLRALVDAALETGCRRGELLGLQWGMVDLDKRTIRLRNDGGRAGRVSDVEDQVVGTDHLTH